MLDKQAKSYKAHRAFNDITYPELFDRLMKVYYILSNYCTAYKISTDTLELAMQYLKIYVFSNTKDGETYD